MPESGRERSQGAGALTNIPSAGAFTHVTFKQETNLPGFMRMVAELRSGENDCFGNLNSVELARAQVLPGRLDCGCRAHNVNASTLGKSPYVRLETGRANNNTMRADRPRPLDWRCELYSYEPAW